MNEPNAQQNQPERGQVDEKTALLIEQTEKSLHQMEQSLGPDHPVIAQLLDTYAKILRQSNIRHLDAINMEARAKAIRAKNNIPEGQGDKPRLSEELEFAPQEKTMSASQLQAFFWAGAILVSGALCFFGYQTLKPATPGKNTKVETPVAPDKSSTQTGATQTGATPDTPDQPAAQVPTERPTSETSSGNTEEALADAKQSLAVKSQIQELADNGQQAEDAGDADKAFDTYKTAIDLGSQASQDIGKPVVSEPLARSYDGLARIMRSRGEEDGAAEMEKQAAAVREIMNRQ